MVIEGSISTNMAHSIRSFVGRMKQLSQEKQESLTEE